MSIQQTTVAKKQITSLLDDNSFVEVGALVTRRSTDFVCNRKIPLTGLWQWSYQW